MKYSNLDVKYKRRSHNIFKEIILKNIKSQFPKILDVGCASGIIGRLLGHKKNIFGIENDEALFKLAVDNCEKVYKLNLEKLNRGDIKEEGFDFIVFGDVLEHIKNPVQIIEILCERLKSDGFIIISFPNIAQIQYRLRLLFGSFDYKETGVLDKAHVRLYTHKTSVELIVSAGIKIVNFYPSGTMVSFINIFPKLLSSQFIFVCKVIRKC